MSATHFSLLSYDVLLHLVKFVYPDDCFNVLLSGILKGFENVNKGLDLQIRINGCNIEYGPGFSNLDIRSFDIIDRAGYSSSLEPSIIPRQVFERLVEGGFFTNNRRLSVTCHWSLAPQYCRDICCMKNLEILNLNCEMKLEQLVPLFWSCPKLVKMALELIVREKLEMDEQQKNVLVQGFQRLKFFHFEGHIDNDSWPVIREMLTWLQECVDLSVWHNSSNYSNPIRVTGGSSTLNPNSLLSLQSLSLMDTPVEFVEWILPACSNIHTLHLDTEYERIDACIKIGSLKKLRKLHVSGRKASQLKEILRNCHQVEILKLSVIKAQLQDFTGFNATNVKEVTLVWEKGPSIEELLLVLVKCRQLRKLSFFVGGELVPTFEVLSYFIMVMNHLEHLYLSLDSYRQLKHLRDKIHECILPSRPNFKFEVGRDGSE